MERIIKMILDRIYGQEKNELEGSGSIKTFGFRTYIPRRNNMAGLVLEEPETAEETEETEAKYWFRVLVVREGTDREYSTLMKSGTADEVLEYLKDDNSVRKATEEIMKLSDKIDEDFDK